jgi:hypothetical protein
MYTRRGWSYSPPVPHNGTPSARRRSRRLARFRVHLSLGWLPRPRLPHLSLPRLRLPPLRWLLRLGPLPLAVALVGLAAWYQLLFPGFTIAGRVVDGETGQPVAGARVWTGTHDTLTAADGTYRLPGVKPPEHLSFAAGGYTGAAQRVISPYEPVSATLPPVGVEIEVADADTGNPVPSARLDVTSGATLLGDGHWRVAPVRPNATFTVQADGYRA